MFGVVLAISNQWVSTWSIPFWSWFLSFVSKPPKLIWWRTFLEFRTKTPPKQVSSIALSTQKDHDLPVLDSTHKEKPDAHLAVLYVEKLSFRKGVFNSNMLFYQSPHFVAEWISQLHCSRNSFAQAYSQIWSHKFKFTQVRDIYLTNLPETISDPLGANCLHNSHTEECYTNLQRQNRSRKCVE